MKSRVLFVLLLLVALFVIISQKNQTTHNAILSFVNPIKRLYQQVTQEVTDRSKSYIFQKESIEKLTKENKVLKKYLLDQTLYLQQVSSLYKKLPSLEKLPYKSITLVDTISYVKLNSFNEVLLTPPLKHPLASNKVYGLIQNNTVGGTALLRGKNLYGNLSSNPRCKFSVFVGKNRTPGIIQGVDTTHMLIKYIPKWANINAGDRVETSGLDGIFFANIPVGTIENIKVENSYKTAYVKSFSDTLHPEFFFLITDTTPRLTSYYEQNSSFSDNNYSVSKNTDRDTNVTSIPKTLQTKESEVDLSEFEIPKEIINIKPIPQTRAASTRKNRPKSKRKPRSKPRRRVNRRTQRPKPAERSRESVTPPASIKPKRRNPLDVFR